MPQTESAESTDAPCTDVLSTRIVDAVASAADTDPLALEPRLYDVVDAEALQRLVEADGEVSVSFDYGGLTVEVSGDGTVSVDANAVGGGRRR